ncbi:MAG TPA: vWA domain-containing protein [Candidatus Binataceae bacterium]|nr:vWA domain-containing protein [Candidatus Binataceae bacterium]
MSAFIIAAAILAISTVILALALAPRWRAEGGRPSIMRRATRFAGGPFPLSIAIHAGALLLLIITAHESRGRDLVMVNLEAGGGAGENEMKDLEMPVVPMPEIAPDEIGQPQANETSPAAGLADDYVRATNGSSIGVIRGGGFGFGHGPGIGWGFPGYVLELRRTGLDVVLVIDGTDSMRLVLADVKARMRDLVVAIHRLVPTARMGIVVYGGEGEAIDEQPLTLSPMKLDAFLAQMTAKGGGEWEENIAGALQAAVEGMDWKPYAKKVIVLVGDSPPKPDAFGRVTALIRKFRGENGTLNTVDVTEQEHERFEREFWLKVHREEPPKISPLPEFYQQTRTAYQVLAQVGGGEMKSLEGDQQVDREVLVLAFGGKWREQIAPYARK